MRNFSFGALTGFASVLAACFVFGVQSYAQAPAANSGAGSAPKPVVVELFTSEGCSDCPPAEALARRMEQQPLPGIDMIVLEEHVDYWNQYGWNDPFSAMEWTERQQAYVSKLAAKTAYTPQMVVDGEAQFVGSNARAAQTAIENAAHQPDANVTIAQDKPDGKGDDAFKVTVGKLAGSAAGNQAEVWLAVTEDGLHSSVKAGENAGHTLYHAAVLRYLHKIGTAKEAGFTGDARVKIKSDWNRKDVNVVVFVQDKKSLRIIGATEIKPAS